MKAAAPLLIIALVGGSVTAHADQRLQRVADNYYDDENIYNAVYVALGSVDVAVGVTLATRDDPGLRAAGYPVIALGGIQLAVGAIYLALTPGWRGDARAWIAAGEAARERDRIASVEAGFNYYKLVELTAAVTGLSLGIVGAVREDPSLTGVGAGLGVASSLQLVMEHATHDVAKRYLSQLEAATLRVSPHAGGFALVGSF